MDAFDLSPGTVGLDEFNHHASSFGWIEAGTAVITMLKNCRCAGTAMSGYFLDAHRAQLRERAIDLLYPALDNRLYHQVIEQQPQATPVANL